MESWLIQLVTSLLVCGALYGTIRADLNNMKRSIDEERRLREQLAQNTRESIHEFRNKLSDVDRAVVKMEGANEALGQVAGAITQALKRKET